MINNFKNFLFLTLLVFTITGCSKKIYEYRIADTVKNKQIGDENLKQMNVKQFYDFIKVKENRKDMNTYITSKSYGLIRRYCKLLNITWMLHRNYR